MPLVLNYHNSFKSKHKIHRAYKWVYFSSYKRRDNSRLNVSDFKMHLSNNLITIHMIVILFNIYPFIDYAAHNEMKVLFISRQLFNKSRVITFSNELYDIIYFPCLTHFQK